MALDTPININHCMNPVNKAETMVKVAQLARPQEKVRKKHVASVCLLYQHRVL